MAVQWHSDVNTNAYGMDTGAKDNIERIEFESGKERTYLKNSAPKKIFSFMLSLKDKGIDSEYKKFWHWWSHVLLSGSLSFYFPDLITHDKLTEYKMTATPGSTGLNPKEVTISVEEI